MYYCSIFCSNTILWPLNCRDCFSLALLIKSTRKLQKCLALWLRRWLRYQYPILKCLGSDCFSTLSCSSLLIHAAGSSRGGLERLGPDHLPRKPVGVPGSWCKPRAAGDLTSVWIMKQRMGHMCLLVCLPAFQINALKKKRKS